MPRPKGCTCGTPKPCKIHGGDAPSRQAGDRGIEPHASGSNPAPSVAPGGQAGGGDPVPGLIEVGAPNLRAIPGGAEPEQGGAAKPSRRRRPDPKPKPRDKGKDRDKPISPEKPDDLALQRMLGELLTMPAIPMAMLVDCAYCRDHFISEGPKAARELVALSITNPALRGALESLYAGWSKITIFGVLAGYLAKPAMHHIAPEPVLQAAGPVLGVPPRPRKPKQQHAPHPQAEHDGSGAPPAEHAGPHPEPFAEGAETPEDQPSGDPAARIDAA